jgi:hypothetical protein
VLNSYLHLIRAFHLQKALAFSVSRIRIRSIRMFLGLPDLHPDPLVTSTHPDVDPAPDP